MFTLTACTGGKVVSRNRERENAIETSIIREEVNTIDNEPVLEVPTVEETPSSTEYAIDIIMAMDDQDSIKIALKRILAATDDPTACIEELENIYKLAIIPRCATEEEWDSVINLRNTLDEMENPFEVYYELACFVHALNCEEEHYQNEFGQTECKTLRKEMESGLSLGE